MTRSGRAWSRKRIIIDLIVKAILYLIILGGLCIILMPLAWMISVSLKEEIDVFKETWIPNPVRWRNYIEALTIVPFGRAVINTSIVTFSGMLGEILSASLVAFGFARLRFPGRNVLFILLLATMMVPYQVTMVPTFILFRMLNWINTFKPLIVPAFFGGGAFSIFLLRQFFMTIPLDLDDAARIDGCGTLGIYWKILMPLSQPVLITVLVFSFMGRWNDYLAPLIYLSSAEKHTVALVLRYFTGKAGWSPIEELNFLMADSLLFLIPCILVFFLAQRYIVQGIVTTGIKG